MRGVHVFQSWRSNHMSLPLAALGLVRFVMVMPTNRWLSWVTKSSAQACSPKEVVQVRRWGSRTYLKTSSPVVGSLYLPLSLRISESATMTQDDTAL